uniref:non-histone chromosomal protein HMG-14-like n=1 Tax=Pristiophorus japonicus TaxID=55135 RepID=UPI00398F4BA2
MPKKAASDGDRPASTMELRLRPSKQSSENPKKKQAAKKKSKAKAAKPQANQETIDDSVPSENGERKSNEAPTAGENEAKSE